MTHENKPSASNINPNDFQLRSEVLGQDVSITKRPKHIKVGKPDPINFFRVHPDDQYHMETLVISGEGAKNPYLVMPNLMSHERIRKLARQVRICLAVSRQGVPILWMAKLPLPGKQPNSWIETHLDAQDEAMKHWVAVETDGDRDSYVTRRAAGRLTEPVWPTDSFGELLTLGFKDRVLRSENDDFVRQLMGEVL